MLLLRIPGMVACHPAMLCFYRFDLGADFPACGMLRMLKTVYQLHWVTRHVSLLCVYILMSIMYVFSVGLLCCTIYSSIAVYGHVLFYCGLQYSCM